MLQFRIVADVSARHLYHSALPLAPNNSLLRVLHASDIDSEVKVLHGNGDEWPLSRMSITLKKHDVGPGGCEVLFSNNGNLLAVSGSDVQVVDIQTGLSIHHFPGHIMFHVAGVSFSSDDAFLAVDNAAKTQIWELKTGALFIELPHSYSRAAKFSPTGHLVAIIRGRTPDLAANIGNSVIQVWDIQSGAIIHQRNLPTSISSVEDLSWLDTSPARIVIQTESQVPELLGVWNFEDDTFTAIHSGPIVSHAVSLQHGLIACDLEDELVLFDSKTLTRISSSKLPRHSRLDRQLGQITRYSVFSPSEPVLFRAGDIFDVSSPSGIKRLLPTFRDVRAMAFSPTQDIVAIAGTSLVQIYDSPIRDLPHGQIPMMDAQLAISRDATTVVSLGHEAVKLSVEGQKVTSLSLRYMPPASVEHARTLKSILTFAMDQSSCLAMVAESGDARLIPRRFNLSSHTPSTFPMSKIKKASNLTLVWAQDHLHYLDTKEGRVLLVNLQFETRNAPSGKPSVRCQPVMGFHDKWARATVLLEHPTLDGFNSDFQYFEEWWFDGNPETSDILLHNHFGIEAALKFDWVRDNQNDPPRLVITHDHTRGIRPAILAPLSKPITHPVLTYGDGWIFNQHNQPILWVDYHAQASPVFWQKWRWFGRRLVIAGDTEIGRPFIFDFTGVDVAVPHATDTYSEFKFSTISITGWKEAMEVMDRMTLVGRKFETGKKPEPKRASMKDSGSSAENWAAGFSNMDSEVSYSMDVESYLR
ncbi:hypothetical protein DXG03_008840 [Asterophora parasitica]|uniref:Uncharacterized protein n=1 Tax=Asterophora parasitica TaxID=117018 RepID=A0A9P7G4L1_9AGAR|nr:hypothetical protein DXG03_008840 [Asterophora parasitica]